jgi:hypothetical protein
MMYMFVMNLIIFNHVVMYELLIVLLFSRKNNNELEFGECVVDNFCLVDVK